MNDNERPLADSPGDDSTTQDLSLPESLTSEAETEPLINELQLLDLQAENKVLKTKIESLEAQGEILKTKIESLEAENTELKNELVETKYKTGELNHTETSLQWTNYTEDIFNEVIWCWRYNPEFGNEPRGIMPFCPECRKPLNILQHRVDGRVRVECRFHSTVHYECKDDDFARIKEFVQQKLKDDSWKDVVSRQRKK